MSSGRNILVNVRRAASTACAASLLTLIGFFLFGAPKPALPAEGHGIWITIPAIDETSERATRGQASEAFGGSAPTIFSSLPEQPTAAAPPTVSALSEGPIYAVNLESTLRPELMPSVPEVWHSDASSGIGLGTSKSEIGRGLLTAIH